MKITKTEDGYELEHRGHVIAYNSHAHVSTAFVVKTLDQLRAELTESQAREAQLREAMVRATLGSCSCVTKTPDYRHHADFCGYRTLSEALAMPHDDTALKARLKAERERCATEADAWGFGSDAATAIRNLGDE